MQAWHQRFGQRIFYQKRSITKHLGQETVTDPNLPQSRIERNFHGEDKMGQDANLKTLAVMDEPAAEGHDLLAGADGDQVPTFSAGCHLVNRHKSGRHAMEERRGKSDHRTTWS